MANYDDINMPTLTMVALVSVILTVATIVAVQVLFYGFQDRQAASERFSPPQAEIDTLEAEQRAKLTEYRVVDANKGVYAVPIDDAMELVVGELAAEQDAKEGGAK